MFIALLLISISLISSSATLQEVLDVNAVNVYLTARNKQGEYVGDLRPEEITVFEDGVPQKMLGLSNLANDDMDTFRGGAVPLILALAMDVSVSMSSVYDGETRWKTARSAALMLIDELAPNDRAILTPFAKYPRTATQLTTDKQQIIDRLLMQRVEDEKTALFDSLSEIIQQLQQYPGRKVLVLCTDGEDNASRIALSTFLEQLSSSDITVLAFTIPHASTDKGRETIRDITDTSGGFAFFPKNSKDLDEMLVRLRQAMRNQYSVWYQPNTERTTHEWRRIQVICHRPGVVLRYRSGYFAP